MRAGMPTARFALAVLFVCFGAQWAFADSLTITVEKANIESDPVLGQPVVQVTLSSDSTKAFASFTQARIGSKIEIRLGERVLMAPVIQDSIESGVFMISGALTAEDAAEIVSSIETGAHALTVVDGM